MNYKIIVYMAGQILKIEGLLMLVPLTLAIYFGEGKLYSYWLPALVLLAISFFMTYKKPENRNLMALEGFVIVALAWILMSVFGAFPYVISGAIPNYIDALFETISGFTTTGATVIENVESMGRSYQFWRNFTLWIGGMGVLVFVLVLLPHADSKSMYFIRAEMQGPKSGKLVPKMKQYVAILYIIYFSLTIIEIILLRLGDLPIFDSVMLAFATISTGGFAPTTAGIIGYDSVYVEMVIGSFMLLSGMNFNLFYFLIVGKIRDVFKNEELLVYLGVVISSIAVITLNIFEKYGSLVTSLRYAFFQVVANITSTGFASADYGQWPELSQSILLLLIIMGACAGSTGGGLKMYRVIIIIKTCLKEIKFALNPYSISTVKISGKAVEPHVIKGAERYTIMFIIIMAISMLFVAADNSMDMLTSSTAVIACLGNTGPGLGAVGPVGNYADLTHFSKIVLSFDMLLGRLEIIPVLLLFRIKR